MYKLKEQIVIDFLKDGIEVHAEDDPEVERVVGEMYDFDFEEEEDGVVPSQG